MSSFASKSSSCIVPCQSPAFVPEIGSCSRSLPASSPRCSRRSIVRPETVVRWHRSFWRLIWRKKSGRPVGRPPADADLRTMIRRQQETASSWSTPSQSSNGKSAFLRLRCSPVQRVLANRLDRDADNLNLGPDPIRGIGGYLQPLGQRQARTVTERQPQFARTRPQLCGISSIFGVEGVHVNASRVEVGLDAVRGYPSSQRLL